MTDNIVKFDANRPKTSTLEKKADEECKHDQKKVQEKLALVAQDYNGDRCWCGLPEAECLRR